MTPRKKLFQGFPGFFLGTLKTELKGIWTHTNNLYCAIWKARCINEVNTLGARLLNAPLPKARGDAAVQVSSCIPAEATATAAQHHLMGDITYDTWPQALSWCAALLLGRRWKKSPLAKKLNNCSQRRKNGCGGNWSPREPQKDGVQLKRWQENN